MTKIAISVVAVLLWASVLSADQRLVFDPTRNNRIIAILGPTDPAPANTVTVTDVNAILGADIDKYRWNGTALEKRATGELENEFPDEWLVGFEAKIDAMNLNAADVKTILKFIVRRQIALEARIRKLGL